MTATLTEEEFSRHVNTTFRVMLDGAAGPELNLSGVKGYRATTNEQEGLERFSVFFSGPAEHFLPQGNYSLSHDQMGDFVLFMVPVGQSATGVDYEAVFNYFKNN